MKRFKEMYSEIGTVHRDEQVLALCKKCPSNVSVRLILEQYKCKENSVEEHLMLRDILIALSSEDIVNELEVNR